MKNNTMVVISVLAFVIGMGLGAWGLIKEDCIGGPGCWVGSGFLKIAGVILIILGGVGMYSGTWGRKR